MKVEVIEIDKNKTYIVNIPTAGTDDPLSYQDEIILSLNKKIKKLEAQSQQPTDEWLCPKCKGRNSYQITKGENECKDCKNVWDINYPQQPTDDQLTK